MNDTQSMLKKAAYHSTLRRERGGQRGWPVLRGSVVAVGCLLASQVASAQSSVTLYGIIDDGFVYANNQNGHSNVYLRQGNVYGSRFGFKGNEDLGGGNSAIFQLEDGFDPNSGAASSAGSMFFRQAFVGVQNTTYGMLTFGRQYTPYYLFVGPLDSSNWLTGATGAHPGDIDGLDVTTRINNSITYTSPTIGGFAASGMYALGGLAGATGKGSTLSAALRYNGGPVALAAGYLRMNNASTTTGWDPASTASFSNSAINLGLLSARAVQQIALAGNYTLANLTLGLNYSNVLYKPGNLSIFHDTAVFNTYGALARYGFTPAFDVAGAISWTRASQANGISDAARYQQYSLRETYRLSKRTQLYALEAYQHATGNTLARNGSIVAAGPAIGDSQNLTPSSTHSQFVSMLGIAVMF